MLYFIVNVAVSWIMVGTFFLVYTVMLRTLFTDQTDDADVFDVGNYLIILYFTLLVTILIISLGVKPMMVEKTLKTISVLLSFTMILTLCMGVYYILTVDLGNYYLAAITSITISAYMFGIILYGSLGILLKGCVHFILMSPTYINMFFIYSFCNLHDCTWGTR